MSRAYRISVVESLRRILRAEDSVSTRLDLLGILAPREMAGLLARELQARGFEAQGEEMVRQHEGVTVTVDLATATVTVTAEAREEVDLHSTQEGTAWDDLGPNSNAVRENLKKQAQSELEKMASQRKGDLQTQVTDRLEKQLQDLRGELDQVVNRVTAEALKEKARRLGQIKEITEDEQTGSLTIVVEV